MKNLRISLEAEKAIDTSFCDKKNNQQNKNILKITTSISQNSSEKFTAKIKLHREIVREWKIRKKTKISALIITVQNCTAAAAAAKSLQLCPTLCNPRDGSPSGSPSLGFSRQEHWSELPFPSPMHESEKSK